MMKGKQKQPWDRLKGEPEAAYARFLIFRNLGPARTMEAAYAAVSGVKKGVFLEIGSVRPSNTIGAIAPPLGMWPRSRRRAARL